MELIGTVQKQIKEFMVKHNYKQSETFEEMEIRVAFEQKCIAENRRGIRVFKGTIIWEILKPLRMVYHTLRIWKEKGFLCVIKKVKDKMVGKIKNNRYTRKRFNQKYITTILPNKIEREIQKNTEFNEDIKFSIVVPLYNTPKDFLEAMIKSVQEQTYTNWELCLADGSDDQHEWVGTMCMDLQNIDPRIQYEKLENNQGISENTNYCLKMSTGDFIGLFDHDDILHPSALYEMRKAIEKENADFLYTDEVTFQNDDLTDIITYHFKPDYCLDNLRANNYICHFTVFSRELFEKVGGFRAEYNGSQDHDMILRLTAVARKTCHIPKVLYFWRSHAASTSQDIYSKTYAIEAGKKAVKDSVLHYGMKAEVESSKAFPTIYRVKYEIVGTPKVSIIIPNKDQIEAFTLCIQSILKNTTYENYEIIIVENNSETKEIFEFYELIQQLDFVSVVTWDKPFNYSAINNYGVEKADGEFILLLNNDTEVLEGNWIQELLMFAQRKDVGAVGAKLLFEDNTIQHAGIILGVGEDRIAGHSHVGQSVHSVGYMGRLFYAQNVIGVTGACLMVERRKFKEVGGLEEELAIAYNDVDFCLKLYKLGYVNIFAPEACLRHYESISRGYEDNIEKKERFAKEVNYMRKKWKQYLEQGDPFYNSNMSLDIPWQMK